MAVNVDMSGVMMKVMIMAVLYFLLIGVVGWSSQVLWMIIIGGGIWLLAK